MLKFSQIEVYINNTLDANLVVAQKKVIDIPYRYSWEIRKAIMDFSLGKSTINSIDNYRWNWK